MDGNKLPKYISLFKVYYKGKHTYKIYKITMKGQDFLKFMGPTKIFITTVTITITINNIKNIFGLILII